MSYSLPEIQYFNQISDSAKIEALDHLFEPCETLQSLILKQLLLHKKIYTSYKQFIEAVRSFLLEFLEWAESEASQNSRDIDPRVLKIISAHPRLGASKPTVVAVKLSEHSSSEQKSLQVGSEEEKNKLLYLNELYESTFPGLRYVVFVNGRSREVIMEDMKKRISRNNIRLERIEAFNAMCDIALDRAHKLGSKL